MTAFLKSFAIALSLTCTTIASTAAASTGDRVKHVPHGLTVAAASGNATFGYRDGYVDKTRHWHHWDNDSDTRNYRKDHARNYRDWDHATATLVEDGSIGRGSADVGGVAYAYRDGFWDRTNRWHRWNDDRAYHNYRKLKADNYSDRHHDRDGGDGNSRVRGGSRVE